jgi:hypothetical protein
LRFLGAFLLLASLVLHLLLGAGYLVSSRYQALNAEMAVGDLSSVSGDLDVSKAELDRMHAEAKAKTPGAGRRARWLGIGLLASALAQLVAVVLLLLRRAKRLALALTGLGLLGIVTATLLEHFMRLGVVTSILLALALGSAALARPVPRLNTT